MNTNEMETADREVMAVVNKKHQMAARAQGNIPAAPAATESIKGGVTWKALLLHLALCTFAMALFLSVLIDSRMTICLVNVGVLICGIAAAVSIDRFRQRCRK